MKFNFAYEKLLRHKKTLEEIAQRDHSVAQGRVMDAQADLTEMYNQIDSARMQSLSLEQEGGLQVGALTQIHEFLAGQKIRIERQRVKIREFMLVAEQKQAELIEAVKEKKTLEKLKERRLREFKDLLKKRELKSVDELVTTRFKREERG